MVSSSRLFNAGLVLLLAAFCFGLFRLVQLRYTTGDIFPAYSSHRADPLGTKVLYESLRMLPNHIVLRNERPLEHLGSGAGTTLFLSGAKDSWFTEAARHGLERFVQTGGRLVIACYPEFVRSSEKKKTETASPTPGASVTPTASPSPTAEAEPTPKGLRFISLLERWDLKTKFHGAANEDLVASREAATPLEDQMSWHSGISFDPQNSEWRAIYSAKQRPVLMERAYGDGSVVVAGDSYFLSNEAQLEERRPLFIAWLVGPRERIIFDESHLGVQENPGVATLLRRYGLGGFVVGLLILIVLWLWRNAAHALKPRNSTALADEIVSDRDSFAGFVHLLRRGIAPGQLPELCVAEWKKTVKNRPAGASDEAIAAALRDAKNPVTAYNAIKALLGSNKWKTKSAS